MKISMGGKNGDLVYCLPVIKAIARQRGTKVTLVTSPLVYQLVPLLWLQPYLQDVLVDDTQPYKIVDGCVEPWQILSKEEGLNLSPQPAMYRPNAPVQWTAAYMEIAGVKELLPRDKIAFPTLWNHRQWYWGMETTSEGQDGKAKTWKPPTTVVLAPESQTLKTIALSYWREVAVEILKNSAATVIVVGEKLTNDFAGLSVKDLRGLTTVSTVASLLAEATLVIAANSLPWHLARHAGTPTFCFQDQYLERCIPIDTPFVFYTSENRKGMIADALGLVANPRTTLLPPKELAKLQAAA